MFLALFQEIKNRQADFMRAFNAGNAKLASEVYDPGSISKHGDLTSILDGYFMPNGKTPVKGRDGIEEYFKQV